MNGYSGIDSRSWHRLYFQARFQTLLLLLFLGGFMLLIGRIVWGDSVLAWLLFGGAFLLLGPAASPQLLMRFYQGRRLDWNQAPELHRLVLELSRAAGLERLPDLYYLPTRLPNALAAGGRKQPVVALSEGLLRLLDRRELAGVLAHEISHLQNDDMNVLHLAGLVGRLLNGFSLFGQLLLLINLPLLFAGQTVNLKAILLLIAAPYLNAVVQPALSRTREYAADLGAVALTGDAQGLISALAKLHRRSAGFWSRLLKVYRQPAWLRTHPPTEERIRRLRSLAAERSPVIHRQPTFFGGQVRSGSVRFRQPLA